MMGWKGSFSESEGVMETEARDWLVARLQEGYNQHRLAQELQLPQSTVSRNVRRALSGRFLSVDMVRAIEDRI